MIRSLKLRGWRSYDALDLELGPGTTFVVAANGIGKTSLMLGLAWAVFGDHSKIDARSCIRAGAAGAEAEVVLHLPDGRILTIRRAIGARGHTKTSGSIDGIAFDERGVTELLEESFGIELDVAARLSLMAGGGQLASDDALDLKSHLYKAFGIAELLATAQLARKVAKEAEKQRGAARVATKARALDRLALERDIATAKAALAQGQERAREHERVLRQASEVARLVERLTSYREDLQRHEQELLGLSKEAREFAQNDSSPALDADPATRLRVMRRELEIEAKQAAQASADVRGAIASAKEALVLLAAHAQLCPTCMRKMTPDDLQAARAKHEHRLRLAEKTTVECDRREEQLRVTVTRITGLLARMEALRPPTPPTTDEGLPEREAAQAAQADAMDALQRCNRDIGALQGSLKTLEAQLAEDAQVAATERALNAAYKREAIALASANAFETAAAEVISRLIEPIAAEVRARWQQLFALDGLTLRPNGTVVRIAAGQELGWDTLSGGERIWARIVTHLLVLASSTKLPFAWFDEPLEHLDPQLRRTVAATLASTTRHGYPKQILVTTYEDALARQLAEDTDTATVVSVRSASVRRVPERTPGDEDVTATARSRRAS